MNGLGEVLERAFDADANKLAQLALTREVLPARNRRVFRPMLVP